MVNFKVLLKTISFIFLIIANIIYIVFFSLIVCNIIFNIDLARYNFTFIVVLTTSIGTTIFFLIKVYIENQLVIKEREMLKEYEDKINEVKKRNKN